MDVCVFLIICVWIAVITGLGCSLLTNVSLITGILDHPSAENILERPEQVMSFNYENPSTETEIMALGYPSAENILERPGQVMSYNYETKVINWVCELLTSKHVPYKMFKKRCVTDDKNFISRRKTELQEDVDIDPARRLKLADYTNWPKDILQKGHLAAAGNHRYNYEAYHSTYFLSNIVPMHPKVNKIIGSMEKQAQKFAAKFGKVYIITGPYFHPKWAPKFVIIGGKVRIPDAIFKLVIHEVVNKPYKYRVRAYFVMNLSNELPKNMEMTKIKLAVLKDITRLKFLCNVPDNKIKEDKMEDYSKKTMDTLNKDNRPTDHEADEDKSFNRRNSRNVGS